MTQATVSDSLDAGFISHVGELSAGAEVLTIPPDTALEMFDAQLLSRHLDFAARRLRAEGVGYYTISSAGHEGNAAVAAATRPTDPALLHYRSGAFYCARASRIEDQNPARDILLGVVASSADPISGGRHKVFGSAALSISPQTSTIGSHLPKAVGMAFSLERGTRLGVTRAAPADAIVVCSFGDASANHSTATGAINAACRIAVHLPVPVLFVCEDNGLGISARTPPDWIRRAYGTRDGLRYVAADGCDLAAVWTATKTAVDFVRETRRPVFLHLRTVRLMGHAGSDVELTYRTPAEIASGIERDPLRRSAELLVQTGVLTVGEVLKRYERARSLVAREELAACDTPHLESAEEIMQPIAPRRPPLVLESARSIADAEARARFWNERLPEERGPLPLAGQLNAVLGDLLCTHPELLLFGEDVGRKGGVYGVTRGLDKRAGMARVFDTILDEQTILGLAIGAGAAGFVPVPEIQYLAYLHNAIDQLRGEAATMQFFSRGQFRNPMVVRIAGYAYQKGFGGHFHNDNAIASLRDILGLIIASPSRGDDAAAMMRTCIAAARVDGSVCVFLEPIAMYSTRDLHEQGDGLWASSYVPDAPPVAIGSARLYGDGDDILLVSFANGVPMSLRAAKTLREVHGIDARVLDLRWLAPLPLEDLLPAAENVGKVLVVDETRRSGGVSEGVIAALVDHGFTGRVARVTSRDSFVPLGEAARHVLLDEASIVEGALALAGKS